MDLLGIRIQEGDYGTGNMGDRVICLQVHGDAAVSGCYFIYLFFLLAQFVFFSVKVKELCKKRSHLVKFHILMSGALYT